jgi:hypothetical protein
MVFALASSVFVDVSVTNRYKRKFRRRKTYFGSQFQRFQFGALGSMFLALW